MSTRDGAVSSFISLEHLLNLQPERIGDAKCQRQRRVELSVFHRIDRSVNLATLSYRGVAECPEAEQFWPKVQNRITSICRRVNRERKLWSYQDRR
jgi:hypothetical protein